MRVERRSARSQPLWDSINKVLGHVDVWTLHNSLTFRDLPASTAHWILIWPTAITLHTSHYFRSDFEPYRIVFEPYSCLIDTIDVWRCKISGERDRCVGAGLSPFNYSQAEQYCGTRMLLPSGEADLIATLYAPTSTDVDSAAWLSVCIEPVLLAALIDSQYLSRCLRVLSIIKWSSCSYVALTLHPVSRCKIKQVELYL